MIFIFGSIAPDHTDQIELYQHRPQDGQNLSYYQDGIPIT